MPIFKLGLSAFFLTVAVAADAATLDAKVFSPKTGVLCDKDERVQMCVDRHGFSAGLTQEYFGEEAGQKVVKRLSDPYFDTTVFTLSNGLHCKLKQQACYSGKYSDTVDQKSTAALFPSLKK